MKNVSSAFREELKKDNRNYIKSADITLKSGTVLKVDNSDLWQNGMKLDTATSNPNSFDLGAIITGQLTLTLNNIDEKFSDYDFTDCTATNVKVGLKLPDGTTESLSYGKFYLNEAKYNGSIITLTFYDSIYKFDRPYSKSSLSYPATLRQIVQDACSVCGVTLGTVTFDQDDFVVQERPDDSSITFRQVLQWVGQIACYYFYADSQGRLSMKWYDLSAFEDADNIFLEDSDGNFVLDAQEDKIFTFVENGVIYPGTTMPHHNLASFVSLNTGLDDVVITGIKVIQEVDGESGGKEEISYQSGNDGYVLAVSKNKLIQGDSGNTIASLLGTKIIGMRFRTFSASGLSDPTIEAGDPVVLIDRKGNSYQSYITNNVFQPGAYQSTSLGAETPARKSATRYSQMSQVYVDYRKEIEKERTDREEALEELGEQIKDSVGLFTTIETQADGSKKYFMHNKPVLSESDIIWSMTAEAWGVSTDGGKTYNAGMTVDGDTIVRILTAVGVNADWIKTGALRIEKNGQVMLNADIDTGQVDIVANSFSLRGRSIDEIAEQQLSDFVDAVYDPAISNLQSQIDGQIETWFYNYIPTTSNAPANQWATDSEKDKHLGDLFYIVDNEEYGGQAYRWAKINNAYTWDYVEDTAVVKALADAADAKDTADQKRRVFVTTPYPPYDVGDLWVGDDTSDLMRCQTARSSGNFNSSDWIKAVKYTDNSDLYDFISGEYQESISNLQEQSDQKAETWYQATDPSSGWSESEKEKHNGDLWYNTSAQKTYIYNGTSWEETKSNPPDDVFDQIDGKAQIFVNQPSPPYNVGDLWFNSSTSDIMTCIVSRQSGAYTASDWEKRNKYTDDSKANEVDENLNIFADSVTEEIASIQTQVDGKIETFYYDYEPTLSNYPASEWTTDEDRQKHIGDLFYWDEKGFTYRFQQNGDTYVWQPIQDSDITEALNQAAAAQDTADGKRRVFITTPVPPYDVGDLWAQGDGGDIMRCIVARSSGSYVSTDWDKASKYTDDTAVDDLDNALDQEGVFNRLTNNGQTQGIYLKNNRIYINATYIRSGTLSANLIKGGILTLGGASNGNGRLEVLNSSNQVIGTINNTGANLTGVFRNRSGREFIEMDESILKGGYGSTVHGRIDLSAQYGDGSYRTVVEALSGRLILKSIEKINIESIADFHEQAVFWVASKMYYLSHVSSGGHIVFASDGQTLAYLASSSKKYKDHVRDLTDEEAEKLLSARVVWFKYKENYLDKDDPMNGKEIPGFYAEELEEICPELIQYNNKGEAEDWNYRTMIPLMVKIIEKQQNEINELKNEISKIKETIGGLS